MSDFDLFKNIILDFAKERQCNSVRLIYNPEDDNFIKPFFELWKITDECKDVKLSIVKHELSEKGNPIITSYPIITDLDINSKEGSTFGEFLPWYTNMNIKNWELRDDCDKTQFYYQYNFNDDIIACIVIPHAGNDFKWLLRIGFKSTFDKWGNAEFEDKFDNFLDLSNFMSNKENISKIKKE